MQSVKMIETLHVRSLPSFQQYESAIASVPRFATVKYTNTCTPYHVSILLDPLLLRGHCKTLANSHLSSPRSAPHPLTAPYMYPPPGLPKHLPQISDTRIRPRPGCPCDLPFRGSLPNTTSPNVLLHSFGVVTALARESPDPQLDIRDVLRTP